MDAQNSSQLLNGIIYPFSAGYMKICTFPAKPNRNEEVE